MQLSSEDQRDDNKLLFLNWDMEQARQYKAAYWARKQLKQAPEKLCSCSYLAGDEWDVKWEKGVQRMRGLRRDETVIVNLPSFNCPARLTDRLHVSLRIISKVWVSHWLKDGRDMVCFCSTAMSNPQWKLNCFPLYFSHCPWTLHLSNVSVTFYIYISILI